MTTYAIAAESDLVTTLPGDVLELALIMALDALRDAYTAGRGLDGYGIPAHQVGAYMERIHDANAEIQAHAEMSAEDGPTCPRCGETLYAYDANTLLCPSGHYPDGVPA